MRTDGRGRYWVTFAALLTATLLLSTGCGDDDTTGPGGGGASGPAGDLAQLLGEATQELVVENEASFESAEFFAPFIAGLLSTSPTGPSKMAATAALQGPCFSESVLGTTFDYDFGQSAYTASSQQGAPASGARFLLYTLNSSGDPQQGSQLGHLDVTCTVEQTGVTSFDVAFSLTIVADNITVLTMSMSGPVDVASGARELTGTGSLTSADGSRTMGFQGGDAVGVPTGGGFTFDVLPAEGVTAAFSKVDMTDGTFFVVVSVSKQPILTEIPDWLFEAFPEGTNQNFSETSPVGFVGADIGSGVFACISGSFASPQITAASDCSNGTYEIPGVGSAERQAVGQGYGALRTMWTFLFDVIDTGVEVAVASLMG